MDTKIITEENTEKSAALDVQNIAALIEAQLADIADENCTMFAFQSKSD